MKRLGDVFLVIVVAVGIWQLVVWLSGVPPFILPAPLRVAETLFDSRELIFAHTLVTVSEVLIGLMLGSILGMATAIHLAGSKLARRLILPILVLSQAVPVFALAPILTLWLGYGLASKIVMTILIIYFPVTSAFHDGLSRVEPGALDLAHCMGATKRQILWRIRFPSALPALGSGLRLAFVYAPIGAIIGEWVGASQGLGYLMLLANGRAKIDLMFACLIVLAVLTVFLHFIINRSAQFLEKFTAGTIAFSIKPYGRKP